MIYKRFNFIERSIRIQEFTVINIKYLSLSIKKLHSKIKSSMHIGNIDIILVVIVLYLM